MKMRKLINLMESVEEVEEELEEELEEEVEEELEEEKEEITEEFGAPVTGDNTLQDIIDQLRDLRRQLEAQGAPEEAVQGLVAKSARDIIQAIYQEAMTDVEFDSRLGGGNAPGSDAIN